MKQGKHMSDNARRLLEDAVKPLMGFADAHADTSTKMIVTIMVDKLKKIIKSKNQ